ncbi:uncharacterized protein TNCV_2816421 [Trichonephila clavipes]|nr:uncharacterized protein TNCV_2816421 [Trichonephila clavipes]
MLFVVVVVCFYPGGKYEIRVEQKHTIKTEEYRHLFHTMIPSYNRRGALLSFRDGNPLQAKVRLFFPEEDTTMPYSGFEPEPTWLQAEGHIHHIGWVLSDALKIHA